eukprot:Pgem_evm2s7379
MAIELGRKELNRGKQPNIYRYVEEMREQRPGMIQAGEQYLFCYKSLMVDYTEEELKDEHEDIETWICEKKNANGEQEQNGAGEANSEDAKLDDNDMDNIVSKSDEEDNKVENDLDEKVDEAGNEGESSLEKPEGGGVVDTSTSTTETDTTATTSTTTSTSTAVPTSSSPPYEEKKEEDKEIKEDQKIKEEEKEQTAKKED